MKKASNQTPVLFNKKRPLSKEAASQYAGCDQEMDPKDAISIKPAPSRQNQK